MQMSILPRDFFFTDSFLPKCENVAKFHLEYKQSVWETPASLV